MYLFTYPLFRGMSTENYVFCKTLTQLQFWNNLILGTEVDATINKMGSMAWKILHCVRGDRHGCRNLYIIQVLELGMECYGNTEDKIPNCSWTESWNSVRWQGKPSQEWDLTLALKNKRLFSRNSHHRKFHI